MRHVFVSGLLFCAVASARADADRVATVAKPPTDEHMRGDRSARAAASDDAPPADEASGIAVPGPSESHPVANTLLAVPRFAAYFLLLGPRFAAAEVDHYLESRSPNAFGRDVKKGSWRIGATLEAEKELGAAIAARVGRSFGAGQALDAYVGGFGARGISGGLRARLGTLGDTEIEPELTLDAGSGLDRAYAGIATRGPLATYQLDRIAGSAAVSGERAGWQASARGTVDREHPGDGNDTFTTSYMNVRGFDEDQRAATGELALTYDSRRPSYRWIKEAAPSTGTLFRAVVAQTAGTADRSGDFDFTSLHVDAQQLFDLFHGDRVLSLGVSLAATSSDAIPFDRLPALGGENMRAFARDELRAQQLVYGTAAYEWPLGPSSRAYVFVEGAATPRARYGDVGGGLRFFNTSSTTARLQVAASPDGDVGAFLQLGAL